MRVTVADGVTVLVRVSVRVGVNVDVCGVRVGAGVLLGSLVLVGTRVAGWGSGPRIGTAVQPRLIKTANATGISILKKSERTPIAPPVRENDKYSGIYR